MYELSAIKKMNREAVAIFDRVAREKDRLETPKRRPRMVAPAAVYAQGKTMKVS